MKKCSKCGEVKPLTEFYREKRNKDGLRGACKLCFQEQAKEWQKNNPEKYKKIRKRYYKNNSEEFIKKQKRYYKDNSEKCKETAKKWRKKDKKDNPEKYKKR